MKACYAIILAGRQISCGNGELTEQAEQYIKIALHPPKSQSLLVFLLLLYHKTKLWQEEKRSNNKREASILQIPSLSLVERGEEKLPKWVWVCTIIKKCLLFFPPFHPSSTAKGH